MWTNLRKEIEKIRNDLGLMESQFQPVGIHDWEPIQANIFEAFCKLKHHRIRPAWLWNYFKLEMYSISPPQNPVSYLDQLIDADADIWLMLNETVNEAEKFWYYHGRIMPIQAVIAESCLIDELYLVSKQYDWLICINHHDILMATGQKMVEKLRQLEL